MMTLIGLEKIFSARNFLWIWLLINDSAPNFLITAGSSVREKRIIANGKLTRDEFKKRNENQIKDEEKKKRADFVFENDGSVEELKQKADFLITVLIGLGSSATAS